MTAPGAYRGLRVVVTGGASGIGRTTAERFLALGSEVAVLDLTDTGLPDGVLGLTADLRSRDSVVAAFAVLAQRWDALDVLVNNAGISAVGTVEENDDDEWLPGKLERQLALAATASVPRSGAVGSSSKER